MKFRIDTQYLKSKRKIIYDELEIGKPKYTSWITGLSGGLLVFVLTNFNNIFTKNEILFSYIKNDLRIATILLIICVFSGLFYHIIKIALLRADERYKFYTMLVATHFNVRFQKKLPPNILKASEKDMGDDKLKSKIFSIISSFLVLILDVCWFINVLTFFLGSFYLTCVILFIVLSFPS